MIDKIEIHRHSVLSLICTMDIVMAIDITVTLQLAF